MECIQGSHRKKLIPIHSSAQKSDPSHQENRSVHKLMPTAHTSDIIAPLLVGGSEHIAEGL